MPEATCRQSCTQRGGRRKGVDVRDIKGAESRGDICLYESEGKRRIYVVSEVRLLGECLSDGKKQGEAGRMSKKEA